MTAGGQGTPVAVFARAPMAGRTKTRLVPALGPEGAAGLYRAFLDDTLDRCLGLIALRPAVWAAGPEDEGPLTALAGELAVERQREGDLGARMAAALEVLIGRAGRGMVIGSDVPTLPAGYLEAAARALEDRAEVVLGPCADGGYYLVGARGRVPPIFRGIRWSTAHTLADTLARAEEAGIRSHLLPPWYDVDTPEDLRLLRAHLAVAPRAAPRTAEHLAIGSQSR